MFGNCHKSAQRSRPTVRPLALPVARRFVSAFATCGSVMSRNDCSVICFTMALVTLSLIYSQSVSARDVVSGGLATGGEVRSVLNDRQPKALDDVGVDEHLGDQIPLDLNFLASNGDMLKLKEIFRGDRPVILSLNYSGCPMLCNLQLTGLMKGLSKVDWEIGNQFRVVSISIDPRESPEKAAETRQKYLQEYGRPAGVDGLFFLTGNQNAIDRITRSIGFKYHYVPDRKEYAHTAVAVLCSPEGRIVRYLYGIEQDPRTLKLSLVEASEGKVGAPFERILLYCFHYDAKAGRYGPAAMNMMKLGGLFMTAVLAIWLTWHWRHSKPSSPTGSANPAAASATTGLL
ncbi:electron transport protein SCO1/SenC [Planctopirus limnophila DSM 3776]|uniref:Electron transport protein SCO1/SenC n=2 Tax=Planctopirus limnophila TaxID=120 RepID=D5SY06_PLAL2|nr:electron transport protein SCO1/SenC [Planctopirus limnophila DSM 3776]